MIRHSCRMNLVSFITNITQSRSLTNKSCVFTKPHRSLYLRLYPTLIVRPDGSAYTVRFEEPRRIIKVSSWGAHSGFLENSQVLLGEGRKLPLDLSTLSEEEKAKILERRRPKKKIVLQREEKDSYDHTEYLKKLGRRKQ